MNRRPRQRDPDHLAFIRQLPCICCLDDTATEACHIRYSDPRVAKINPGGSAKPHDKFTTPMCSECHRKQHGMNERTWWERHGIDPVLIALALYSATGDAEEAEQIIRAQHPVTNVLAAG